ncbi:MAG: DUF5677 domain-containing protein [Acidobacteriota bacterium]|nr:DUF5677 domain-containing protein [Acidobacteriota bacterium]
MIPNLTSEFNKIFVDELRAAAEKVLSDFMRSKLQSEGLDPDAFPMEEFANHFFSESDQDFTWNSDQADAESKSIVLDTNDVETLSEQLERLLDGSTSLYQKGVEDAARGLVRQLEKDWPEQEAWNSQELHGFKKRLLLHWGTPLTLFRILLQCAEDIFADYEAALQRSRARSGIVLREVLLSIQARTLRTSRAVLLLLENGLADDAYARWRTLYELNVFATLIADNGDDAAARYRDHEFVDLKKAMDNELNWGAQIPKRTQKRIRNDYAAVLKIYGADFRHPNAWASPFVSGNNKSPKFSHIEKAAYNRDHPVPPYKESSLQVHGGRLGVRGLGSSDEQIAAGHSNLGLEIPLMHSALALAQITQLLLNTMRRKNVQIMYAILMLERKIDTEARKAARKLVRDERAIRRAEAEEEAKRKP